MSTLNEFIEPTIDQVREYYNSKSSYHESYYVSKNSRIEAIYRFIDLILKDKKIETALDIGCGVGLTSEYLSKKINHVTAIDLSEKNIAIAKRKNPDSVVKYLTGDFTEMNLGKFDIVCLFDVFEHIRSSYRDMFLENVIDHAVQFILVSVPNPDYLRTIREKKPHLLQIIDNEIRDEDLSMGSSIIKKIPGSIYNYYVLNGCHEN